MRERVCLLTVLCLGWWSTACDDVEPAPEAAADRGAVDARVDDMAPVVDGSPDGSADGPDAIADATVDAIVSDMAIPLDASPPDVMPDAMPDASPPDATPDANPPDAAPPACPEAEAFDYACDPLAPETCPGGTCLFGACLGPILDADRWADCGDGLCGACETADGCPADCGPPPNRDGRPAYDPATTITVRLHGFNAISADEFADEVYGGLKGPSDVGDGVLRFGPPRADGRIAPEAVDQFVSLEYYGAIPADWLTPAQIAEIEALDPRTEQALRRYALISAYFIRHRLDISGASHANLLCHSMGCHITRYLIEHDLAGLASERRIARWVSFSGVIAGARLARLFDNPQVRDAAELLQLNTSDFVHMNPDYVTDHSARWNHRLRAADNPNFTGIAIHHIVASDPRVSETANIVRLLDIQNPGDEPNDGIMFSLDELFDSQDEAVRLETAEGDRVLPTHTWLHRDHTLIKEAEGAHMVAAAALYHRRRVWVTLRELTLFDDRERDGPFDFEDLGEPPSEVAVEVDVGFGDWAARTFGVSPVVHRLRTDDDERSSPLVVIGGAEPTPVELPLYAGPVFDGQPSLALRFEVLEMDRYRRFEVLEDLFDPHERLLEFAGEVPIADGEHVVESPYARAVFEVRVGSLP